MNDLLHYAPLLIAALIAWAGYSVANVIHVANVDRRTDHRELMDKLDDIETALGRIDLIVEGIASDVAPPIDPENPPY